MNQVQSIDPSRRGFLRNVFSAGALVLGARLIPARSIGDLDEADAETLGSARAAWHPSVYLGLDTDGSVIIVAHRSEMGTGIRTSLPIVVADELEAEWKRVKVEQAIGDTKYGSQDTDGSNSIRSFYQAMRVTGATARTMLENAAASKWNVAATECRAKNHEVVHLASGRKLAFGDLVSLAAQQPGRSLRRFGLRRRRNIVISGRRCRSSISTISAQAARPTEWTRACPGWFTRRSSARRAGREDEKLR